MKKKIDRNYENGINVNATTFRLYPFRRSPISAIFLVPLPISNALQGVYFKPVLFFFSILPSS